MLREIGLQTSLEGCGGVGLAARIELEADLGSWKTEPGRAWTEGKEWRESQEAQATLMGGDHNPIPLEFP